MSVRSVLKGLVIALLVLVGVDVGLGVVMPGRAAKTLPFVDADLGATVFQSIPNQGAAWLAGARMDVFRKPKPAGVFRVVVVGSSAVDGDRMPVFQSIPGQLERLLGEVAPQLNAEVLNLGIGGSSSPRQAAIVMDAIRVAQPDLVVYAGGNNEFHLLRAYKTVDPMYTAQVEQVRTSLHRSNLYRTLVDVLKPPAPREAPKFSVPSTPGFNERLQRATVTEADRELIRVVYRDNVLAMAQACRESRVAMIVCTLPENDVWTSADAEDAAGPSLDALRGCLSTGDVAAGLRIAEEAVQAQPESAFFNAQAGLLALQLKDYDRARRYLEIARELDPRPLRQLPSVARGLVELGAEGRITVCDLSSSVRGLAPNQILDLEQFQDACHPRPFVNAWIASLIALRMKDAGLLPGDAAVVQPDASAVPSWTREDLLDVERWPGLEELKRWADRGRVDASGAVVAERLAALHAEGLPLDEGVKRLGTGPDVVALCMLGHHLFQLRAYDEAAASYRAALAVSAHNPVLHRNLAHALLNANNVRYPTARKTTYQEALKSYRAAGPPTPSMRRILRAFGPVP